MQVLFSVFKQIRYQVPKEQANRLVLYEFQATLRFIIDKSERIDNR